MILQKSLFYMARTWKAKNGTNSGNERWILVLEAAAQGAAGGAGQ